MVQNPRHTEPGDLHSKHVASSRTARENLYLLFDHRSSDLYNLVAQLCRLLKIELFGRCTHL